MPFPSGLIKTYSIQDNQSHWLARRAQLSRHASNPTSQSELSFRRIGISCAAGFCLTQLSPQPTEPLLWTFLTLYISNKTLLCLICLTNKYFPQRIPPLKGARGMFRNTQSLLWTSLILYISNKSLLCLICLKRKLCALCLLCALSG